MPFIQKHARIKICNGSRKIQSLCPVVVKQQHKVAVGAEAVSVAKRAHLYGIRIYKFRFHVPKTVGDLSPVPIWLAGTDPCQPIGFLPVSKVFGYRIDRIPHAVNQKMGGEILFLLKVGNLVSAFHEHGKSETLL